MYRYSPLIIHEEKLKHWQLRLLAFTPVSLARLLSVVSVPTYFSSRMLGTAGNNSTNTSSTSCPWTHPVLQMSVSPVWADSGQSVVITFYSRYWCFSDCWRIGSRLPMSLLLWLWPSAHGRHTTSQLQGSDSQTGNKHMPQGNTSCGCVLALAGLVPSAII